MCSVGRRFMRGRTIATVFGTRPEIIKLSMLIEELDRRAAKHVAIHTNQHFDENMDSIFMRELEIRPPDFRLKLRRSNQALQFSQMVAQLSPLLADTRPDFVVVLGDTNTTVAGAMAAKKCGFRVAHIESGCRSFDRSMPEEQNRIVTDHISDVLFAPTKTAVDNLRKEGIHGPDVHLVGSTLVDVCRRNLKIAERTSRLELPDRYILATLHRRGNIEDRERFASIISGMAQLAEKVPVIFPVHPHTRMMLSRFGLESELGRITRHPPMGYLDFLKALGNAEFVITDSGGVQQEAQVLRVPIITTRAETEWVETVQSGLCRLVDADKKAIVDHGTRLLSDRTFRRGLIRAANPYSEKNVSRRIASILVSRAK